MPTNGHPAPTCSSCSQPIAINQSIVSSQKRVVLECYRNLKSIRFAEGGEIYNDTLVEVESDHKHELSCTDLCSPKHELIATWLNPTVLPDPLGPWDLQITARIKIFWSKAAETDGSYFTEPCQKKKDSILSTKSKPVMVPCLFWLMSLSLSVRIFHLCFHLSAFEIRCTVKC